MKELHITSRGGELALIQNSTLDLDPEDLEQLIDLAKVALSSIIQGIEKDFISDSSKRHILGSLEKILKPYTKLYSNNKYDGQQEILRKVRE